MRHFPIFVDLEGRRVTVAGGGETALAKLRLLLKTKANIAVFASAPDQTIEDWARDGRLTLFRRRMEDGDAICARLHYSASDDAEEDRRTAQIASAAGALTNIVDNLDGSQFITPAIVDRDPVTVAIGTEGAAPVLARAIKSDLEMRLPAVLGLLARIGKRFRRRAEAVPPGRRRRDFWNDFYFRAGPLALSERGEAGAEEALDVLLHHHRRVPQRQTHVTFVGAGPGDPELLTLKARNALHEADVVIHDRLVSAPILELARREAKIIDVGKTGFGPSTPQSDINDVIVSHARNGAQVVRLKSGDATIYGRLDDELETCVAHGLSYSVIPGITAASAAVSSIGQSLTRRHRNSSVRFVTGRDVKGFAEHDWRSLARPGEVAAIYMGKRSARFVQGRLMMHNANPATPVTVIENASRPNQRILEAQLGSLATDLADADMQGPAVMLYGLSPRTAQRELHGHEFSEEVVI